MLSLFATMYMRLNNIGSISWSLYPAGWEATGRDVRASFPSMRVIPDGPNRAGLQVWLMSKRIREEN